MFTGALSSEVSALALGAVPATVGCHVISATWLQNTTTNTTDERHKSGHIEVDGIGDELLSETQVS
jgi:hypothetical protein